MKIIGKLCLLKNEVKPVFSMDKDGPKASGLLDTPIQFQQAVVLTEDIFAQDIHQNTWEMGNFLFSASFGPCLPVIAKLSNGQLALYHATTFDLTEPLKAFTTFTKGEKKVEDLKAVEVYVFQKPKNKQRAPILAMNLRQEFGLKDVPRIHIPYGYTAVFALNEKGNLKIVLTNELTRVKDLSELKLDSFKEPEIHVIDLKKPGTTISIIESAMEMMEQNKQRKGIHFPIPEDLIEPMRAELLAKIDAQLDIMTAACYCCFSQSKAANQKAIAQLNNCKQYLSTGNTDFLKTIDLSSMRGTAEQLISRTILFEENFPSKVLASGKEVTRDTETKAKPS